MRISLLWYAATWLAAMLLAWWQLGFAFSDLKIPWDFEGDGAFYYTKAKELMEFGTAFVNTQLGAPGTSEQFDLNYNPAVQYYLLRGLGWLTGDATLAMNLYYWLGFGDIAVISMWVMRRLGIGLGPASVCGLLYALQYYHFWRGVEHPMLSSYWLIPLIVLIALRIGDGRFWVQLLAIGVCFLFGATYVYYSFFACFLLLVAGIARPVTHRRFKPLVMALLCTAAVVAGGLCCLLPSWQYDKEHGDNPAVGQRYLGEAEHHALKIAQVLLPHEEHRVPWFRKVSKTYHEANPASVESRSSSIGLVAGLGFVLLLLSILVAPTLGRSPPDLTMLSVLNLSLVLLVIVGGLSSLVAFVVPEIRGYNRASIFLAFFGLLAIALLLDQWEDAGGGKRAWFWSVLVVVLVGGALDQTPRSPLDVQSLRQQNELMASWVGRLENALPADAMVFQLPYQPYPEAGPQVEMEDYAHFAGYFWGKGTLRYSYGAMKGREDAEWLRGVANLPPDEMVEQLRDRGFAGIWLDRSGYEDRGEEIVTELLPLIGPPMTEGELCFWRL